MGSIAAIVLDLILPGPALLVAIAGLQQLAGADPSVVLCELGEGFESLWISHQRRSIRQAVGLAGWWCKWSKWPSAKGPQGLAAERKVLWRFIAPA